MPKLRFDPVTYQFYYKCPPQDGGPAKAAGFGWDPARRRYYTEDPNIALGLESCSDSYVKLLLADVFGAVAPPRSPEHARGASKWLPRTNVAGISSSIVH
jgi:hypothetical protein